jgi:transposase
MSKIARLGVDTSKGSFELHGVDAKEQVVLRKTLRRKQLLAFLVTLEVDEIGLEACGASHHWARELQHLGHRVVLVPAQYVKSYVPRGKNDKNDARAICTAMSQPWVRERLVPVKSLEQSAGQMLLGVRESLIKRRTQLTNSIRGHAAEFGLVAAKGLDKIEPLLVRIADDESLPALAREMFATLGEDYGELVRRIARIDKRLLAFQRDNEMARRLLEVPTIGPIGACLWVTKVVDPQAFRCGRNCAAWLGLTPKDHSTAGKQRLGAITRAGDESLRATLVAGATAYLRHVRSGRITPSPWLAGLLQRKPPKLVAVALANKTARIAWKLMTSGERYDPEHRLARTSAGPTSAGPTSAGPPDRDRRLKSSARPRSWRTEGQACSSKHEVV